MDDLPELLRRWSAGTATAAEAAELEALLRDREGRAHLVDESRFGQLLTEALAACRARDAQPRPGPATVRLMRWQPRIRRPAPRQRQYLGVLVAVAALLAVTILVTQGRPAPAPPSTDVMAAEVIDGTVDSGVRRLRPGDRVAAGEPLKTGDGMHASLRCPGSGILHLDPRCAATVTAGSDGLLVALTQGSIQAEIEAQRGGRTVRVRTRLGEVTVLGTRFSLSAEPEVTALTVTEGHVRFTRLTDGLALEVGAGHSARIGVGMPFTVAGLDLPRVWKEGFASVDTLAHCRLVKDRYQVDMTGGMTVRLVPGADADAGAGADAGGWSGFTGALAVRPSRTPFTVRATLSIEGTPSDALAAIMLQPVAGTIREIRIDFRDGSYRIARQLEADSVECLAETARHPAWPESPEHWEVHVETDGSVRLLVDGAERVRASVPELAGGCHVGVGGKGRSTMVKPMTISVAELAVEER